MKIQDIDKNLKVDTAIDKKDIRFYKAEQLGLFGLMKTERFLRLPEDIAAKTNKGVGGLCRHTAGGRVRFVTDSEYVAISCKMPEVTRFSHMPLTGTSGFDLYVDNVFQGEFVPPVDMQDGYESIRNFGEGKLHEIMIDFPLYNSVTELYIGLQEGATVKAAPDYAVKTPVVFYGSSITQGGCASRPGNSYQAILSRRLDFDYVNLGFSGSARGEEVMAEYIAGLEMSAFVLDYDYNAPSAEHLENTHARFFDIIRSKQPELPVLIVSKPNFRSDVANNDKRREVIRATYERAVNAGDKNVWFLDGETLFGECGWDSCTVDGCHPNDLGFWRMAETMLPVIENMLKKA